MLGDVKIEQFKGAPIFSIDMGTYQTRAGNEEPARPFSFGEKKARLILAKIEELKQFVEATKTEGGEDELY